MKTVTGQTSMIAIVLAVMLIVFITMFLVASTLSTTSSELLQSEYRNMFAHSTLLSLLRTDTDCGQFRDVLKNVYFDVAKCTSSEFEERLPEYMFMILNGTGHTNYEWLIVSSPRDFTGEDYEFGDSKVRETPGYWDALIPVTWVASNGYGYTLDVKIFIRPK